MSDGFPGRPPLSRRGVLLLGLVVLLLDLVMLGLCRWQYQKGQHKEAARALALTQRAQPPLVVRGAVPVALPEFRAVTMTGRWVGQPLFLDNQVWQQRAGYHVYMAFQPDGANTCILVRRGWLPKNFVAAPQWAPDAAAGVLQAEVTQWPHVGPLLTEGRVVQGLDRASLPPLLGCALHPALLHETAAVGDGLQRVPMLPSQQDIGKHWSYAGQWLLFTLMLSGAYVVYVVRRLRRARL